MSKLAPRQRTTAVEDYLRAIWKLAEDGRVTTTALAGEMGVTPASATSMLKRLASLALVDYEPYYGASLTAAGREIAVEMTRHHRLLESYLAEALGLGWDVVHLEADRLEHHLSEEVEARLDAALGSPTHDPHGHAIPSVTLAVYSQPARPLSDIGEGTAIVVRVPDGDPALLRRLAELGLVPNQSVLIIEPSAAGGPLLLEVAGSRRTVAVELAAQVQVGGHAGV